jgi:hypothetical protein
LLNDINEREFSLSDVMVKGWSVFCQQFKNIAVLVLITSLPFHIVNFIVPKGLNYVMTPMLIITPLLTIIGYVGVIVLAENTVRNDNIELDWRAAISKALTRFGSCAITSLLGGLIIIGLSLLLVIPGIIWMVYYTFILQVVVLRGIRGKAALDYSKSLVIGRWWKIFWISLVPLLISNVTIFVQNHLSSLLPNALSIITATGLDIFDIGFTTVFTTILFLNLDSISVKNAATENRTAESQVI